MTFVLSFPGCGAQPVEEVGGKGHSLIRLADAGLPIPPGCVLTTSFFEPWIAEVQSSSAWARLVRAKPAEWELICEELEGIGGNLELTAVQQDAFDELCRIIAQAGNSLLAVRSSSPQEDLASASFAGGYETQLGVRATELEAAVRACFVSCFDARVLAYKQERGFELLSPRIAVVVQQQLDSDVAGVAFSLNPLTNDFDEAVIDASWGQGESVVAGTTTPDHFVVDKVKRQIVNQTLGAKRDSVWLTADGGTFRRQDHRSAEWSLTDSQLTELVEVLCRIEELYERPIDIEWAFQGGQLFILQARPMTTYVPLPCEMVTQPGDRRMLYSDIALATGLTINAPISPLGLDWMQESVKHIAEMFFASWNVRLRFEEAFWFFAGGRMYQNLSNILWLASPQKLSRASEPSDALMAAILANVDAKRYRSAHRPCWTRWRMLRFMPLGLWRMRRFVWSTIWAVLIPQRANERYREKANAYVAEFSSGGDESRSLGELRQSYREVLQLLFDISMPALAAGLGARWAVEFLVRKRVDAAAEPIAEKLSRGLAGNVVAKMGIAMYQMAKMLERADFEDVDRLAKRIAQREMPANFLRAWDSFLAAYGWRGPSEMDLASPRYKDQSTLALKQMSCMSVDDPQYDPEAVQVRQVGEREAAREELLEDCGWLRRSLLRHACRVLERFGGERDTPKHHNLLFYQELRERALEEGRELFEAGRLDAPDHVFDLTFRDLETAASDPSLDLRGLRSERTRFLDILRAQVRTFPPVIDSRGRIPRPATRDERPGELTGKGVSPGVVQGPVKLLFDPHHSSVEKGEVLVAHTTDPGWTPLFVNAAAVVLEIGGVLQHGAVVAREFGKPCVVGIDQLMTRLQDGQMVEVDGTAGVVRVLGRSQK